MSDNLTLSIFVTCLLLPVAIGLLIAGLLWVFKNARKSRLAQIIMILIPISLGIGLVPIAIHFSASQERDFNKPIREYMAKISQFPISDGGAYIIGNLLIFDNSIDMDIAEEDLYPEVVGHINTFDDVDTFIVIACEGKKVGTYTGGKNAYQDICNLTVVDKTQNIVIGQESFLGPEPPYAITCRNGSCNNHGGLPFSEMKTYIQNLPIK